MDLVWRLPQIQGRINILECNYWQDPSCSFQESFHQISIGLKKNRQQDDGWKIIFSSEQIDVDLLVFCQLQFRMFVQ